MEQTIGTVYPNNTISKESNTNKRITTDYPPIGGQLSYRAKKRVEYAKHLLDFALEYNEFSKYYNKNSLGTKAELIIYLNKEEAKKLGVFDYWQKRKELPVNVKQSVISVFTTEMGKVGFTNLTNFYKIDVKPIGCIS